jgi:hypothetical protein
MRLMKSGDLPAADAIGISKRLGAAVALRRLGPSLRSGRCVGSVGPNGSVTI